MNSFTARHQHHRRYALRKVILLFALLMARWCVFDLAKTRAAVGQDDRLTPIQREIERQRQRLSSSEIEERRDALTRLGNLKRQEASRVATVGLSDSMPVVRVTGLHAITSLPPHEAATLTIPLLKDKSEFVRREAGYVLGEIRDRSSTPPLNDALLHDKKPSVRAAAAVALGEIADPSGVEALVQVLTIGSQEKSKKSKTGDEFILRAAAKSLGQIGSRSAVPALIATLENENNPSDVRREAAVALGLIGDSSAMAALKAIYTSAEDPYLSEAAHNALRKIAHAKN